jgi:glycosyltransferase involved in cell wall biosynthesis
LNPKPLNDLHGVLIIATGPHGFGGAVQAFCRALNALAHCGAKVFYVALEQPYPLKSLANNKIEFVHAPVFDAGAIGSPTSPIVDKHILASHVLTEAMVNTLREQEFSRLILWGTYLYPYATSSLRAYSILESEGKQADLWLSVSGSEIWEIGAKIPSVTRSVLLHDKIKHIITSSRQFAEEIQRNFAVEREIQAIYPMIDTKRFVAVSEQARCDIRAQLGLSDETFVITCHCNMRPVKCPEDVLYIAEKVAKRSNRPILLYMIGPIREDLMPLTAHIRSSVDVQWLGIARDVEKYLQASDVEINCSWHDSFNMSLAEAMACSVPCVSTDVVGVGKEILAADAGFLFPYLPAATGDEKRYQEAVNYVLHLSEAENERKAMGKRGADHALKVFAPELITEQYLALFETRY